MLATIKGMSSLCEFVSLALTSVERMSGIPMSLAVGCSVALAAGTMWLNNQSKNKVIGSLRDDIAQQSYLSRELARQVARGEALQKRLQKKDTTKSNRGNSYTLIEEDLDTKRQSLRIKTHEWHGIGVSDI